MKKSWCVLWAGKYDNYSNVVKNILKYFMQFF